MAETMGSSGSGHPNLNLSAEEKRVYGQLLKEADPDGFGAVSGDVAVKFFERTKLQPDVLGQIWQIADVENRGFLTPAGFGVVLRLIGHAQAGRTPTANLATQPAPLPKFDTIRSEPPAPAPSTQLPPPTLPPQATGPPASPSTPGALPIRVPALSPDKVATYSSLFEKSGAENGFLSGLVAKQIFERAGLPNDVLGKIWALSDTQGRGALDVTEFVIAMHLLASHKSGQMRGVPSTLPPGLYEAAQRRAPARAGSGSRPGSSAVPNIPAQFTGGYNQRPQSPITRQQVSTPLSSQSTGEPWLITPADKARFDAIFATVDRPGRGFITGDQAVEFFGNARLPEEVLAQIWDLADINSEGQLSKDEFAVAMYLIRQQRGTRDGRGVLPSVLPPALIPPSLRKQVIPPTQPTAPAFENAPVTKPRSAADDLFGLDAFGPPPTAPQQVAQSTGGTDAGPFANPPTLPPTLSPQNTSGNFRPFVPTSSFGQSIIPQSTGSPAPTQARSPPATEDLLGDTDPVVSSRLTNETSELGNLSNQVSSLSKQMTELHGTRKQTSQELSTNTAQKRAFEGRLAQLRTLYEKEVNELKALQDQLATSKNDTKRLQQDIAVIEGSHQDLTTQYQQVRAALEADQQENVSLKDRIRQSNQEIEQLKPQLEKLKSDARQQKGLVAINRKQLATNEAERDRIRAEIAAAHKQVEDALREAEESARELENSKRELEEAQNIPVPAAKDPSPVASPAPSTSSNPFFRRTTETSFSPPIASPEAKSGQSTFDSIFGPSFAAPSGTPPPPVSFSNQSSPPAEHPSIPTVVSPTPSTPINAAEPPPPPQSKQITSAALPFRQPLDREDSISSSVKVAPPVSRLSPSDTPRALTPTTGTSSPQTQREFGDDPFSTAAAPDEEQESIKRTLPGAGTSKDSVEDVFGKPSAPLGGIPGAFPEGSRSETPAPVAPNNAIAGGAGAVSLAAAAGIAASAINHESNETTTQDKGKGTEQNFDDVFGGPAHQRSASQQAADFDSAFAGFDKPAVSNGTKPAGNKEFPDIQEFGGDDDDSDSDYSDERLKFDDDFNTRSPPKDATDAPKNSNTNFDAPAVPSALSAIRPTLDTAGSTASSLPGVDQQKSPPTYDDAVPQDNPSHFPREYKGLLPERQDPTSPQTASEAPSAAFPPGATSPSYGPEAHARRPSGPSVTAPPPTKAAPFDFDSAFAGVGAAPVADDDDESDDDVFAPKQSHPDFDPTFDSPIQSKPVQHQQSIYSSVTNGAPATPDGNVFRSNGTTSTAAQSPPTTSHDWDSLFAPLDTKSDAANSGQGFNDPSFPKSSEAPAASYPIPSVAVAEQSSPSPQATSPPPPKTTTTQSRPQAGRALSTGTEHDDPILKSLTAMGWSREESLSALEKFDYNIDKAADYLTFKS